jgi:sialic acid synthase SpsE
MTDVVAELSGSHGGILENALRLITEAKAAGADAVKFQCFSPERLAAKRANNKYVQELAAGRSLLDLYRQTHTPRLWFPSLIAWADSENIAWFSSAFDPDDVAFLETMNCPRYKISAFEMLDGDLINAVVATGKPIVMSVRPMEGLTVLLASNYGTWEGERFGISDHAGGGMWAQNVPMVERHICLPGVITPDSEFSSTPDEFKEYVRRIRKIST